MRNTLEIEIWMKRNGVRQVGIQKELKMNSPVQVRETIYGIRNDRRVLGWLLGKGCPVEYLGLPVDMSEQAKAA